MRQRCQGIFSNLDGLSASDWHSQHIDQLLRNEYGGEGHTLWDNFGIDEHVKVCYHIPYLPKYN